MKEQVLSLKNKYLCIASEGIKFYYYFIFKLFHALLLIAFNIIKVFVFTCEFV
jgi:hypothetical protein